MPQVDKKIIKNSYRHNVIDLLKGSRNLGIELGVAQGIFSERMVKSGKFSCFYGVDIYADTHDVNEYKSALKRVGLTENFKNDF